MTIKAPTRGVLILAGGRGERFWPWSTPARPKQLLPLASGGRTLLAATFDRALRVTTADRVVIMTAESLVEACQRECPGAIVVGEPVMRNTAPAIAAAAAFFAETDAFAVLPADHAIDHEDAFAQDFARAFEVAERDAVLVTFAIPATEPDPNFGYLQRGATLADRLFRVARFTEKPTREKATEWLAVRSATKLDFDRNRTANAVFTSSPCDPPPQAPFGVWLGSKYSQPHAYQS